MALPSLRVSQLASAASACKEAGRWKVRLKFSERVELPAIVWQGWLDKLLYNSGYPI